MNRQARAAIRAAIKPASTTKAHRENVPRILSFVPDRADYERASQILRSRAGVRPEVLELTRANIARNSMYSGVLLCGLPAC